MNLFKNRIYLLELHIEIFTEVVNVWDLLQRNLGEIKRGVHEQRFAVLTVTEAG